MIAFQPADDEAAVIDQVRRFAETEMRPQARACEVGGCTAALSQAYAGLGVTLAEYPESAGGGGLGFILRVLIEEELAWGDPGIAAALPGPDVAGQLLLGLEPSDRDRWLGPFGRAPTSQGTLAVWEPGDLASLDLRFLTVLKRGAMSDCLNGTKIAVRYAADAALHLVACQLDGTDAVVAIPPGSPGIRIVTSAAQLGLRALPSATVTYRDVPIPHDSILATGALAVAALCAALRRARLIAAARIVGASRAAFEYAARYALERRAFGRAIADHQAVAFMIADAATEVDAARLSVWRAARAIDTADSECDRLVALAHAQAREAGFAVTSNAVQVLGGHGYVQDHPVEKWMRDVQTLASWWRVPAYNPASPAAAARG